MSVVLVSSTCQHPRHLWHHQLNGSWALTQNPTDLTRKWISSDFDSSCWLLLSADYWLWLFALPFDHKSKFLKEPTLLSFFCLDFNFGLHFFIWNFKIGQLAHSSLWFLQRHSSMHLYEIFSCLSNLKLSSSVHLKFEG